MALYSMECGKCSHREKLFANTAAEVETKCLLVGCDGKLKRVSAGLSTQIMERLDNGAMTRALERPRDAERLTQERADSAHKAAGTSLNRQEQE